MSFHFLFNYNSFFTGDYMASQEEKLKELLERMKRLTTKQAEIEKKIMDYEATVKPKEPEE
jgi:hypothetical protein